MPDARTPAAPRVKHPHITAPHMLWRPTFAPMASPRQEAFCHHYVLTGNATKSAVAAGYSPRSARSLGYRMLTNDDILDRIREMRSDLGAASRIDLDTQMFKLEHLFREALEHRQLGAALRAVELQTRLAGLFPQDECALALAQAASAPRPQRPARPRYRPGEANGSDTEYWMLESLDPPPADSPTATQHETSSTLPALRQPS
ncbi:MAG: terminase small subunit [Acetobacterales bacterium]